MIEAIKKGDEFAFEQIYILFRGKVYAYFLKKTKSPADAADLLQTTFFKLWKYRHLLSVDYEIEQQLFYIARNTFIDYIRKENKKTEAQRLHRQKKDTEILYPSPAEDFDAYASLQHALSSLPEMRKKIFVLHKLHGYSYKEIAEMLSISVKSVDNNLTKAIRQLRKLFYLLWILLIARSM